MSGVGTTVEGANLAMLQNLYDVETPRVLGIQGGPRSPALGFRVTVQL